MAANKAIANLTIAIVFLYAKSQTTKQTSKQPFHNLLNIWFNIHYTLM